ncbi:MAG: amidohydrolase, partial [Bacillota bacterium]|nr:amidohydrolase [Bacillota bacterium]
MKKFTCLLLTLALVFALPLQASAVAGTLSSNENTMLKTIDSNKAGIIDISKKIWNLKELSSQEFKSSALLEDALEKQGFKVKRGLTGADPVSGKKCDVPTGFTATYENVKGGPTIGIMLEYDALPNGHSCGHNLISSSGYAAALGLKEAFKTTPGKLIVFGTPAEEFGGPGKTQMLAGGNFDGVDVVFETHGSDRWNMESQFMGIVGPKGDILTFKGVASHASASPEKGKSALDAAMLFGMGIEFLREHILDGSRIHYCIMEGGKAPNIVPEETKMNIYVRSMDSGYLKYLQSRIDDIAKGAALMTGTSVEYTWDFPWLAPTPVPTLYDFAAAT